MTRESLYIYCLIHNDRPQEATAEAFVSQGIGARGDRVYSVGYRDLAAVASDSPGTVYEPVLPNLLAHQLVLEEVMEAFSVLPVRFGTVAPGAEAIREKLLKDRYDELQGLLREMEGKVEMVLKASWREGVVFSEIVAENPEIRRLRDELLGRTPEETRTERVQLGRMVEVALWARRAEDAQRILSALRPIAYRVQTNKIATDMMVLNAAFLVERTREEEFDRAVEELDRETGKRVAFQYFGPLPPYDFTSIIVHAGGATGRVTDQRPTRLSMIVRRQAK